MNKGEILFEKLCKEQLYSDDSSKRDYAIELMAAFDYMGEDLYPLLEKAESANKRIVVIYGDGIDQIKDIVIN